MFNSPLPARFPWEDLRKIFRKCQRVANVPNGKETFLKISTGWAGHTSITDDRQMTDGRAIAYSERERQFTFAKNSERKTYYLHLFTCLLMSCETRPRHLLYGDQFNVIGDQMCNKWSCRRNFVMCCYVLISSCKSFLFLSVNLIDVSLHCSFYASYILFYFFSLLPSRILDPLRFQAGGRTRRPNLGLVCFVLMFAVFLVNDACVCYVVGDLVLVLWCDSCLPCCRH